MFKQLLLIVGILPVVAAAQTDASSTTSSIKVEDAAERKNKVDGDIDEDITNAKMRADSGSKSRYSLSSTISYTGGSLSRAFGKDRPNLSGVPGRQTRTSASASLDGRVRFNKNDSMTLGTSFALMTPFQGDMDRQSSQLNVFDPALGFSRVGKLGNFQLLGTLSGTLGTSQESRAIDQNGSATVDLALIRPFQNGLTLGLGFSTSRSFFSTAPGRNAKNANPSNPGKDDRAEQESQIAPYLEYAINDTYSVRTVGAYFNYAHLYGDPKWDRQQKLKNYQSVGVGMAVTRDVYLYPNVQFVPEIARLDFTNVALWATINAF